jgi:hypothetical protein
MHRSQLPPKVQLIFPGRRSRAETSLDLLPQLGYLTDPMAIGRTCSFMRRAKLSLVAVLATGLSGCFLARWDGGNFWPGRSKPAESAPGPDVVFMDAPVLEAPLTDRYVSDELWTVADEQIQSISPSLHKSLEENGLRVGLVRGRPPDGLMGLLTNKRTNREGLRYRRASGNPATVVQGLPRLERCDFSFWLDGKSDPLVFEQAQCQFQLLPALDPDGKVRIQFTPQIEFQDPKKWSRLNPIIAINVQGQRSTEPFTALRWETALAANEWLLIGPLLDKAKSLGCRFLVSPNPDRPIQRLIAVRAGRFASASDLPSQPGQAQPLAAQVVRGQKSETRNQR